MARLSDQAERHEDMVKFMRNVADMGAQLHGLRFTLI